MPKFATLANAIVAFLRLDHFRFMTIDKNIRCKDEAVNAYIVELEEELSKKETAGVHKFMYAANKMSGILADDLVKIGDNNTEFCQILSNDKDDKTLERVMTVLKSVNVFKDISDAADALTPEVIELIKKDEEKKPKAAINAKGGNVFEAIQEQYVAKGVK